MFKFDNCHVFGSSCAQKKGWITNGEVCCGAPLSYSCWLRLYEVLESEILAPLSNIKSWLLQSFVLQFAEQNRLKSFWIPFRLPNFYLGRWIIFIALQNTRILTSLIWFYYSSAKVKFIIIFFLHLSLIHTKTFVLLFCQVICLSFYFSYFIVGFLFLIFVFFFHFKWMYCIINFHHFFSFFFVSAVTLYL